MSELITNKPNPDSSPESKLPGRWLVDPEPKRFLLPITGAWILGLDWLFFSQDVLSLGLATPILVVVGFLLGGAGTLYFQRRFAKEGWLPALLKALLAGIAVGVPWPIFGTIVGGWILLASGLPKGFRGRGHDKSGE